ncbi:MAG: uncharacterized protein QOJ11_593 [Frankiales bacterium]|jgi:uncharacterized protein|nr:uncharacterized protein [Frankiales bacterium]
MSVRRGTALLAAAVLVALSGGAAAAAGPTKPGPTHTSPARPTKPVSPPASAVAPDRGCAQEIADGAQVLSGDELAALRADATHLAGLTSLRIRTVASVPGGDLNAYEKQLQLRCGWADATNVRQPRLLVFMVATTDRQMGIYPGPDLVGTITDSVWLSIEQESMRPLFADGDWSGGLQAGVDALDQALSGGGSAGEPAPVASTPSFLRYDANGQLIQGDGSAEHPFIDDPNGVLAGSPRNDIFPTFGLIFAIFAGLGVIAMIVGISGRSRPPRTGRYDPTTGLWDSGFGERHGGGHHGGFGGFDGGGGGGGSSSDGGGGSSGF